MAAPAVRLLVEAIGSLDSVIQRAVYSSGIYLRGVLPGYFDDPPAFAVLGECAESGSGGGLELPSDDGYSSATVLDQIIDRGFLWGAVPKSRRSLEKRQKRKFGLRGHFEQAIPKRDIVACVVCGHWHEKTTICGNCYDKVRKETANIKASINRQDFYFNSPKTETVVVYDDEKELLPKFEGKYIVEPKKTRPSWWPRNLLTGIKD